MKNLLILAFVFMSSFILSSEMTSKYVLDNSVGYFSTDIDKLIPSLCNQRLGGATAPDAIKTNDYLHAEKVCLAQKVLKKNYSNYLKYQYNLMDQQNEYEKVRAQLFRKLINDINNLSDDNYEASVMPPEKVEKTLTDRLLQNKYVQKGLRIADTLQGKTPREIEYPAEMYPSHKPQKSVLDCRSTGNPSLFFCVDPMIQAEIDNAELWAAQKEYQADQELLNSGNTCKTCLTDEELHQLCDNMIRQCQILWDEKTVLHSNQQDLYIACMDVTHDPVLAMSKCLARKGESDLKVDLKRSIDEIQQFIREEAERRRSNR